MNKIQDLITTAFELKKDGLVAFDYIKYNTTDNERRKLELKINAFFKRVVDTTKEFNFNWASDSINNITNIYFDDEVQINDENDVEKYLSKIIEVLLEEEKFLEKRYKEKNLVNIVSIDDIDNFKNKLSSFDMDDIKYTKSSFYEEDIKEIFINIFNIVYTQKDSPIELCDLYCNDIKIKGKRYNSAIVLKGKSLKKPMTPANTDLNGTQLIRLASNGTCSLLIVQHVNEITEDFKKMLVDYLRVYTRLPEVKVCFIDGKDTIRILRGVGVNLEELSQRTNPKKRK